VTQTVPGYLEAVVRAHASRPAMLLDGRSWTYRELWEWSASIARWLLDQPRFAATAKVGLIGRNGPEYLAAHLGIMRAGGVAVPLNERLPAGEVAEQLELVEAVGLLTADHDEAPAGVPVWPIARCVPQRAPRLPRLAARSAACVLLTSGTTGRPKGVVHSHATLLHAALQVGGALPFGPGDRSVAFLPFYASIPEQILPALLSGGTVDVVRRFDPDRVAQACVDGGTSFDAVPTIMARLLDAAPHAALRRLRWVSFASEPMPVALLERWWSALPEVRTHQFYGMTECLTITHAAPEELRERPHSVGRPYPTSEVAVLDDGEITCRTPARMVRYLGDPAATRTALTTDGAIRTGDLGALAEDGSLVLTGRKKDLIISGGFNVAPSEIEAVACRHPGVASAVVVGIPDVRWGETPVVVAVGQPGADLAPHELLAFCRAQLAGYKRPSAAALVADLPLTGIGKSAKSLVRQQVIDGEVELVRA
jgi:acyl-CoA synthetase (AMP-forming)/AMP-acid ligase II